MTSGNNNSPSEFDLPNTICSIIFFVALLPSDDTYSLPTVSFDKKQVVYPCHPSSQGYEQELENLHGRFEELEIQLRDSKRTIEGEPAQTQIAMDARRTMW